MQILALSVKQAWADLLFPPPADPAAPAPKTCETRLWSRGLRAQAEALVGKRIAIHASRTQSMAGWTAWANVYPPDKRHQIPTGCIIGTVKVLAARLLRKGDEGAALCEIEYGAFGLFFCDPRRLPNPIPYRGQLGFFPVEIPEEAPNVHP